MQRKCLPSLMKLTKKEQIEQKAMELFWKHGFKKITIDEICKKANVSRKTFYTFFDNKNALIIYLYSKTIDQAYVEYDKVIKSDISFSEKLEKLLNQKIESTKNLSMEFVADLYHPDAGELLTFFNQVIEQSMQFMRNFLIEAQKTGDIDPQLNIDYIMFILSKTIELCGTKEMMDMFPNASTMTKQISQTFIFGIAPPNKK